MSPPIGCEQVQRVTRFIYGEGEADGHSAIEQFAAIKADITHLKTVSYWLAGLVGVAVVELSVGLGLIMWEWAQGLRASTTVAALFN